jgi:hypothetical protein
MVVGWEKTFMITRSVTVQFTTQLCMQCIRSVSFLFSLFCFLYFFVCQLSLLGFKPNFPSEVQTFTPRAGAGAGGRVAGLNAMGAPSVL